eukprot:7019_1
MDVATDSVFLGYSGAEEYMPYYQPLKLELSWWSNKYEPCRREQADEQKKLLAQRAQILSSNNTNNSHSHHTEAIHIQSQFNVESNEVINQIKCISSASDIRLKPLKELFIQS